MKTILRIPGPISSISIGKEEYDDGPGTKKFRGPTYLSFEAVIPREYDTIKCETCRGSGNVDKKFYRIKSKKTIRVPCKKCYGIGFRFVISE